MLILKNELTIIADSFYIPKKTPNGEDAHFFCETAQVIGVADGVGGWARRGIDAGEYARELMRNAAECVKESLPAAAVDPKAVLAAAFEKTAAPGSSTACILSLAGDGRLHAAYVGDSGFVVIRGGQTVYRSPAQQYRFNTPYQLGAASGGPGQAAEVAVAVEACDVVVAGTDGLFDNLFPLEVEMVVERCIGEGMMPGMVARELATAAREKSMQRNVASPFEVAAYKAGVEHFGGKRDDITVVVAYVTSSEFTFH